MKPENWMKCDISPEDDPAYLWYLSKFHDKLAAHGFYNRVTAMLHQCDDHWLTLDDIFVEGFAAKWGWKPESVRQAVAYLLQAKLFVRSSHYDPDTQTEDTITFSSPQVLRDVEIRRRKSETNSQNGRKGGLKSGTSKRSPADRRPAAGPPPSVPQAEERRGEEIRVDEKRVSTPLTPRGGNPPPPPEGEDLDPIDRDLEQHFPKPDGQDWTRTNAYMNSGRRPLRKYPRIWLTRPELRYVLEQLRAKLPETHWREVFMAVDLALAQVESEGKDPSRSPAAKWLQGWALKEVLEKFRVEKQVARAQG